MTVVEFLIARIVERLDLVEHVVDHLREVPHRPGSISYEGHEIFNPRHVLAECAAISVVVESGRVDHEDAMASGDDTLALATEVLYGLAEGHADHPDFDPTWRLPG